MPKRILQCQHFLDLRSSVGGWSVSFADGTWCYDDLGVAEEELRVDGGIAASDVGSSGGHEPTGVETQTSPGG
eukprot:s1457_g24.t1